MGVTIVLNKMIMVVRISVILWQVASMNRLVSLFVHQSVSPYAAKIQVVMD